MSIYILYHANCFDGTGAKYAAWLKFGDEAKYIPVQYNKPFPKEVPLNKTTDLFILDFSYSKEILNDVNSKVNFLKVLDHHKTAKDELAGLDYAEFDMDRSGAILAWNYFFPGEEAPLLLQHVQDGDLWKFKMTNTERVRAALPLMESSNLLWREACRGGKYFTKLIEQGDAILESNKLKVAGILKNNVKVLPYKGYKAGVFNTTTLVSESGNAVCTSDLGVDFSLSYFLDKDGKVVLSFRSEGDFDVTPLAKELGGGGHKNASGAPASMDFLSSLYKGLL
jgi:oligoribonuclease NrnB/cAMP/cGMP phosphodiesterase (DHH superfamily)